MILQKEYDIIQEAAIAIGGAVDKNSYESKNPRDGSGGYCLPDFLCGV